MLDRQCMLNKQCMLDKQWSLRHSFRYVSQMHNSYHRRKYMTQRRVSEMRLRQKKRTQRHALDACSGGIDTCVRDVPHIHVSETQLRYIAQRHASGTSPRCMAPLGLAWLSLTRPGSAWFGLAQPGSTSPLLTPSRSHSFSLMPLPLTRSPPLLRFSTCRESSSCQSSFCLSPLACLSSLLSVRRIGGEHSAGQTTFACACRWSPSRSPILRCWFTI